VRGYHEESAEVIALRALREAARRFVGAYLLSWDDLELQEIQLGDAALKYAEACNPPKKKRSRSTPSSGKAGT
jgi:hypothetical protein